MNTRIWKIFSDRDLRALKWWVQRASADDRVIALGQASYRGWVEGVRVIRGGVQDLNASDLNDGVTALRLAACNGHVDVIDFLLE